MSTEFRTEPLDERDGLNAFLYLLMTHDETFGLGVTDLIGSDFLPRLYDGFIFQQFKETDIKSRILLIKGIEYGLSLSFDEIDTKWANIMGQYDLNEEQWQELFVIIRDRLTEDFGPTE